MRGVDGAWSYILKYQLVSIRHNPFLQDMKAVKVHPSASLDVGVSRQEDGPENVAVSSFLAERYVALDWFQHAPGFVAFLVGPELTFVHANEACKRLVGREHLVGLPFHLAVPEMAQNGVPLFHEVIARRERHVERARKVTVANTGNGLRQRYIDFVLQPVPEAEGGGVAGILVLGSDVTIETLPQRALEISLTHDVLTGLPNFALFRDRLKHALLRAARTQRSLQVVALDLDTFTRVTAMLGNEGRAHVLHTVAQRIERASGPDVTVARDHEDRFLLLLEGAQQANDSGRIQEVVTALAEPFEYGGQSIHLTCCIGCAVYPLSGQTADALLLASEHALAAAKKTGAGIVLWDDLPPNESELEQYRLGFALRKALTRGELQLCYRPQVDLVTGEILVVEAKVRWTKAGEEIPADTLIRVAEECGLVGELGYWVLRTACIQTARWRAMGFGELRVAVNVSAQQFSMRDFETTVMNVLSESGLPGSCLDLELAESVLMEDADWTVKCLSTLKRQGVRICIDDFGIGYSSLANLQWLPIDVLKVDGSFLKRVPEEECAATVVVAVVTMGHSLGLRIVAQGVGNEAQCEFLSRHMCDEVQGDFLSKPLLAAAMTDLLGAGVALAPHVLRFNRAQSTLLLVDDEPSILSSLRRLLRNEDYRILTANSGSEGLQVLAEHSVDVIVSDQRMPGMTGVEFLRAVRQLRPDTVRIVLSGFTELQTVTDAVNAGAIYKFLTKPWDDEQLRGHIREAFSYSAMANDNRLLALEVRTANQKLAEMNRQLQTVLAQQRSEIEHGEISLDIVREALGNVPLPVLASDDLGTVVLANHAARALFANYEPVLGSDIRDLFPALPASLPDVTTFSCDHRWGEKQLSVNLRQMGLGSQSRGWLVVVMSLETV